MAESERRLLFDSETVLPVNTPDIPAKTPLSNCGRFRVNYEFLSEYIRTFVGLKRRPAYFSFMGEVVIGCICSDEDSVDVDIVVSIHLRKSHFR